MKKSRLNFYKKIESRGMLGLICAIAMKDYLENGMSVEGLKDLVVKNLTANGHADKLNDVMKIFDDKIFEDAIKVFGYTSFIYVDNEIKKEEEKPVKSKKHPAPSKKGQYQKKPYQKKQFTGNRYDYEQPKTNASRFEIGNERRYDNYGAKKKVVVLKRPR